jgi:hypothetical protein
MELSLRRESKCLQREKRNLKTGSMMRKTKWQKNLIDKKIRPMNSNNKHKKLISKSKTKERSKRIWPSSLRK